MNNTNIKEINKGKPYSDEELILILSDAPTKLNCEKYASVFKRSYNGIYQIYQWAMTPKKNVLKYRPDDKFIGQIKRICKLVKWVSI